MGSTPCLLYAILCVVFEAMVINLCNRDIATNFGAVAGKVILVDSCAIIFICCDCYLFFWKKKGHRIFACCDTVHLWQRYCSKQIFWWN